MNPIDSSKKWFLNKLIPLIEREGTTNARDQALIKNEGENPKFTNSGTSKQDKYEQYSDLLEDSEYPKK